MWGFTAKGGESTRPPGLQTTTNYEYGGLTFGHEKNCHFKLPPLLLLCLSLSDKAFF